MKSSGMVRMAPPVPGRARVSVGSSSQLKVNLLSGAVSCILNPSVAGGPVGGEALLHELAGQAQTGFQVRGLEEDLPGLGGDADVRAYEGRLVEGVVGQRVVDLLLGARSEEGGGVALEGIHGIPGDELLAVGIEPLQRRREL